MKGLKFFVYLALLLLGTYHAIGVHHNKPSSFQHPSKASQLKLNASGESCTLNEDNIGEEPDDDKTNNLFAKKYRLLRRFDFLLSDAIHLNALYGSLKDPRASSHYYSDIYIVQRVLRI